MIYYLELLGLVLVWVALPLLPAILIYWLFPQTRIAVKGPLANLTFKASGAFGAYILVFAAISYLMASIVGDVRKENEQARNDKRLAEKQYWTIEVPVQFVGANNKMINNQNAILKYLDSLQVETRPIQHELNSAKVMRLKVIPSSSGYLPVITFKLNNFEDEAIDLQETEKIVEGDKYLMRLKAPVKLLEKKAVEVQSAKETRADESNAN